MTHILQWRPWLLAALVLVLGAQALPAANPGSPYGVIVTRNVFGLVQPPPLVPVVPPAPLAKVVPVGITTMVGDTLALLKISVPAAPPEPAKDLSSILAVGQRDGPIEVVAIDARAGSITVNNAGTVQVLSLDKDSPRPQAQPQTPPHPSPPPPMPMQTVLRR